MALTYPENTVWYIEARPWSGPEDKPGFAPVKAGPKGSGAVVTFTTVQPNGERKTRSYILTCAHVVRDSSDCLLEDIICYPPGKGFIGTAENARKSGTFENANVQTASVSKYSPCQGKRGSRPEHLRNDPASDWVLLEIHDPAFRNQPSVKALHDENLSTDQTVQVIGFPGGDLDWKNGDIVTAATARDFRPCAGSEAGMFDYDGPEETRPGMSGGGIFDDDGALVGIHRSNTDAVMKRGGIRADAIARRLRQDHQMEFASESSVKLDDDDRIQQLQINLASRVKEIMSIFAIITEQLQRMSEEGVQEKDATILNHVEQFLDRTIDSDTFIGFCQLLDDDENNDKPDYQALAGQLKSGRVIFCLGQELSHLFGAQLPSTEEIKKHLGEQNIHVPLSELCEQKELLAQASKRTGLLTALSSL
ncbi:MAG: trypsin-like peptidase domain-containing protein, partial [Gammaproteobacteria bacterium]|nr:trypsin-like peptidase domain-containing protein [Gammaproteobacteria bacterium]